MYVARILYPVETLGIGKRIGIWLNGCPHGCRGCSNPELWETQEKYSVSLSGLIEIIRKISSGNTVDGFTITGGEPFFQPCELNLLTKELKKISDDILIYTGYTLGELKNIPYSDEILERISVLIDGRYIPELNNNYPLRGSENQNIYIINPEYSGAYAEYMKQGNRIQNFTVGNSVISVGIHERDFRF